MKYNLLGAVSTIALGAAFGIGTQGAARAALTCAAGSGNTVGSFTCFEVVTGNFAATPTNETLSLDDWVSNASAGFTQSLDNVTFTVSESLKGQGDIKNSYTLSEVASYFAPVTLGATNGSGAPSNLISPPISKKTTFAGPQVTVASGASVPYSYSTGVSSGMQTVSGSLAGFVGPGTFSAIVTAALGSGAFVAIPGVQYAGTIVTSSGSPTIQLTYHFTTDQPPPSPTPEPASLALLGVGLAGLGSVRRRRKA